MMDQRETSEYLEHQIEAALETCKLLLDTREKTQILVKLDEAYLWAEKLRESRDAYGHETGRGI